VFIEMASRKWPFYFAIAAREGNLCTLLFSGENNKHCCQMQPLKRTGIRSSFVS
jgi:hypothetical protein